MCLYDKKYLDDFKEKGYAIIKNVFSDTDINVLGDTADLEKQKGLQYKSSFRHKNILYLMQSDPIIGKVLRFCQWPSFENETLAKYRIDKRYFEIVQPLLGDDVKQIINQIIWKTPGVKQTSYGYHQDARFRRPESAYRDLANSFVQVALAIDPHTVENGCLVFIEGSHKLGNLKYITENSVHQEEMSDTVLTELGLDDLKKVNVVLDPGDVAIWHPYLLHGSGPNTSDMDRRTYLNGYVNGHNVDRGEWAFKDGEPVNLAEHHLVQFEELFDKPEPHYLDGTPYN